MIFDRIIFGVAQAYSLGRKDNQKIPKGLFKNEIISVYGYFVSVEG